GRAAVGGGQIEPGAIQVETDLTVAGPFGDALDFGKVEGLAQLAAYGGFDLDRADGNGNAAGCAAVGLAVKVLNGEGSFAGSERNEMKAAEGLTAIAAVVEKVAPLL